MLSWEWVDAVTQIVGQETRRAYRHLGLNTCVHSSRVLHTVLRREGVRSEPTAVSVMALDAVGFEDIKAGAPMSGFMYYVGPDVPALPPDPSVKVLTGKAWNAHMVLTIEPAHGADLIVADVTAPQFNRPQYGVTVSSPITFDAPPADWRAGFPGGVSLPDGGGLIYRRLADDVPEAHAWKKSSAWTTEASIIRAIADVCLRRVAGLDVRRSTA